MNSILQNRLKLMSICADSKKLIGNENVNSAQCLKIMNEYTQCATCLNGKWFQMRNGMVQCMCPMLMQITVSHGLDDNADMDVYRCDNYSDIREFDDKKE